MTEMSRHLARVARRNADQQTNRVQAARPAEFIRATVATVTPAGAADGVHALVTVTFRGQEVPVADYPDSYTPAIGHRVLCVLPPDGQLSILHRSIGQP